MRRALWTCVLVGCGAAATSTPVAPVTTAPAAVAVEAADRSPDDAALATIVAVADGEARPEDGVYVGWDGVVTYFAVGLPALSADGRRIAMVRSDGDGTDDEYDLVTLFVDGTPAEVAPLFESHAGEEETEAEVIHQREAATQIHDAMRYLAEHGFRALPAIRGPDEEPLEDGVLAFAWSDDGWVTVSEGEATLFHARLVVPDPPMPDDLDADAEDAWWMDHACDVPGLESAAAWLVDDTHALVETVVNPPPDECTTTTEHRIVSLPPPPP